MAEKLQGVGQTTYDLPELERRERLRKLVAQQDAELADAPALERRERLRKLVAQQDAELADAPAVGQIVVEDLAASSELFYTEGSDDLKAETVQQCSEVGDDRPISGCKFAPNGKLLVSCGWGGMVSLWSSEQCRNLLKVRAHEERCTDVAWHPAATLSQSEESVNLATACADATAALLSAKGEVIQRLVGHTDRLARLAFHPMGRHLGTASFDATWRLWDVNTGQCVMEQEGHSRACYCVAFHPDGSLAASSGLDAIGRLWDCRTGRSIYVMEGHVKEVLALDFSPNGHQLVSGSADHSCKFRLHL
eukprot:gene15681-21787_t